MNRARIRTFSLTARVAGIVALSGILLTAGERVGLAQELQGLDPRLFPVPEVLEPNVDFWTRVYTAHDSHHVLLHDERHLQVVYEVLDFTALDAAEGNDYRRRLARRTAIREAEAKYKSILHDLATGKVSEEHAEAQARVEKLFATVPGDAAKFSAAIHRFRTQTCLADRFAEGIERSGYFMDRIEEIFRQRGLPLELSRMPFVESLFQLNAHSSASAAGIWQFVRPTARLYLEMEAEYDERFDPLRASEAAADHLRDNYRALKTWPLAITAYNHGANGMRRAVRRLGTRDLGEIVRRYRSRTFGFASKNFYAEVVAAIRVYEDRARYFPDVEPYAAWRFDTFDAPSYLPIGELARRAAMPLDELRALNPALARQVWSDGLYLPKGYPLRVPPATLPAFETAYAELDEELKSLHQVGHYYQVRHGDTLGKIAARHSTTVGEMQRVNRLANPHQIRLGQRLLIPPRGGVVARVEPSGGVPSGGVPSGEPGLHTVRRGETLSAIARAYGVNVRTLVEANALPDGDRIHVGQRLTVPGGSAARSTHAVRSGDTLSSIARLYGTTVQALQAVNRLRSSLIHPGQILVIP